MAHIPDKRYQQLLRREEAYLSIDMQSTAAWMDAYHEEQVENGKLRKALEYAEKQLKNMTNIAVSAQDRADKEGADGS